MCGITGYIATNPKFAKEAKSNMMNLLIASEKRGDHATGIAFVRGEKIICHKSPLCAYEFTKTEEYRNIINKYTPRIMIGHTRLKTQGDPKDNNNNHPVVVGNIAVAHNGQIMNDSDVFECFKFKRQGEVDSEAIAQLIAHFKKNTLATREAIQKSCLELRGSIAIAVINAKNPRELHLVKSGNPIVCAYQKSTGIIYFGSEVEILELALYKGRTYHGIFYETDNQNDFIIRALREDQGYRFTAEKITYYSVEKTDYTYSKSFYLKKWEQEKEEQREKERRNNIYISHKLPKAKSTVEKLVGKKKKAYRTDFDPTKVIKKPSEWTTTDLEARFDYLADLILNQTATFQEQTEYRRIENMVIVRSQDEEKEAEAIKKYEEKAEKRELAKAKKEIQENKEKPYSDPYNTKETAKPYYKEDYDYCD